MKDASSLKIAVLVSRFNERVTGALLKGCLDRSKGLVLREQKRTEAGGLLPWIFVVDREETR